MEELLRQKTTYTFTLLTMMKNDPEIRLGWRFHSKKNLNTYLNKYSADTQVSAFNILLNPICTLDILIIW
jgi:hypothetical protein